MSKAFVSILIFLFWPITILLRTSTNELLSILAPSILLLITYFLHTKGKKYFLIPTIFIPVVSPKLSLFPLLFSLFFLFTEKKKKHVLITIALSITTILTSWNSFKGQTIFTRDYEAEQKILRDTKLYDSTFMARAFHNKARIYLDKLSSNFFIISDINNYFFGNHPRQIPGAQNTERFPFLSFVFFLIGLLHLKTHSHKFFLISYFCSAIVSLAVLTVFDGDDFVLWLPIGIIILHGLSKSMSIKFFKIFILIFLIFTFTEYLRMFI